MNCTKCGKELKEKGTDYMNAGTRRLVTGIWQMIQCKTCGHVQKSKCILSFEVKGFDH